jgi:AAA15 family ATPase/GTPase
MLLSFSVSNYLSFREKQILELVPEGLKEQQEHLHIPYLYDLDARLLKSVGLFGHNSHGKSNFIKAYQFFQNFIFTSFSFGKSEEDIKIENFRLNEDSNLHPTEFEVIFLIKKTKYKYGFALTSQRIVSEWLYYSEVKVRENHLFHREAQEIKISRNWNKETNNKIDKAFDFTKKHQLLLSVLLFQDSISRIDEIGKWFKSNIIITDITLEDHFQKALLFLSEPKYRQNINKFIEKADLGFTTIEEKIDSLTRNKLLSEKHFLNLLFSYEIQNFEIYAKHEVYNKSRTKVIETIRFELLKSESSGTIKYLTLAAYLSYAIKEGLLIIIDELDAKFHPLLFQLIIKIYNDAHINTLGSQMIFTTHGTILLANKILRRDQLVAIDKDKYGESTITRMHNSKKPIRIDTPIEKEFLKGSLGGSSQNLKTDNLGSNTLFD